MFIIEGIPAVVLGVVCLFVLTDRPAHAKWLSPDEREWLQQRLDDDSRPRARLAQGSLWQVLFNRNVLILSLVLAGSTAVSSGVQLWQPQIIQSYGLTNMQTGLLNSIPFALASIVMIFWGRHSDLKSERVWHAAIPLMLAAVSFAGAIVFNSLTPIVVLLCLAAIGIYAGKGPAWAVSTEWLSASTAPAGLAQINAISNLAGFGTTFAMGAIKDATGRFSLSLVPLVALSASAAVAILLIGYSDRAYRRAQR
jgi:sugar phosphate permease